MHKVLIAVDGSDHALKAVAFLVELSASTRCEAVLLNVQPEPEIRTLALYREAILAAQEQHGEEALAAARAKLEAANVPYTTHIETGDPAKTIARVAAETGADHIVMGTRGLGSLAGMMLGSVATKVLHLSPLPVTLVK